MQDAVALETGVRTLGELLGPDRFGKKSKWRHTVVTSDERFLSMVRAMADLADESDARMLARSADAIARLRSHTPETNLMLERTAAAVARRSNAFKPYHLTTLALAFAECGIRGERRAVSELAPGRNPQTMGTVVVFVRGESLRQMQEFDVPSCVRLLAAYRRWGITDQELFNVILERMSDINEEFTVKDIVETMNTFAKLGLARRSLLRRLCQRAFSRLEWFSSRQLVAMLYALSRLRFLTVDDVDLVLRSLVPGLGMLTEKQVSQLLFALVMVGSSARELTRILAVQYHEGRAEREPMADIDFVWSLCSLEIACKYRRPLSVAMSRLFSRPPSSCGATELLKLHDVICSIRLSEPLSNITIPGVWREACAGVSRREAERFARSDMLNDVQRSLARTAPYSTRPRQLRRHCMVGPFLVDFFDEASRLVVDVDLVQHPTTKRLRHAVLTHLGYQTLCLEYWDWRDMSSSEDKVSYLTWRLSKAQITAAPGDPVCDAEP
uniref:RAP domain-containing protein n=1 Tax=Noctiluca scintillans TaxID=2966 RepID=A0A7S1AS47_NOCSC